MAPISRWLGRLKIAHQLILSGVVFALPITVLLGYVTKEYNQGIRTGERELAGTKALEVCPVLLHDLRGLEARENLASAGAPAADPLEVRKRVDAAVSTLQGAAGGETRELAGRLSSLWKQLQEHGPTMAPAQRAAAYQQMVETASQLVPVILDDSALILDSHLRTYYLMNVTGPLLLQSQAAVAEAGALAARTSAQGRSLDARDLAQLHAECGALLNTILPRMRYSLEAARREDRIRYGARAPFQTSLPPLFEQYVNRVSDLSTAVSGAAGPSDPRRVPQQVQEAAAAAEDAGVNLGSATIKELRALLVGRIAEDKRSRAVAWLMGLLSVGLAAAVMATITLNITRPLNFVAGLATDIAAGRVRDAFERQQRAEFRHFLPQQTGNGAAPARDEIYKLVGSVSTMTESLNALLVQVAQACNQVAGSAGRLSIAVRQVEAAVSEQAASTTQVSATSKQISATAQDLAATMAGVTRMSEGAAGAARGGINSLEGIRGAIEDLIHSSAAMTGTFRSIHEKTGNIEKIITAITKVANRTNLLSLNAAIEAEKEGEKAGGFSVIALEMRRLADQTAVAALEIEKQVRSVQQAVQEGVSSVESYAGETRSKSAAVNQLSSGLGKVIEGATKLAPEFEIVNRGMQMQSQGAGQIAEAMLQLRDAASQTKGSIAEFRQVAEDLQTAVQELQAEVGRFAIAS